MRHGTPPLYNKYTATCQNIYIYRDNIRKLWLPQPTRALYYINIPYFWLECKGKSQIIKIINEKGTRPNAVDYGGHPAPDGASPTQPYKCSQYFKVKVKSALANAEINKLANAEINKLANAEINKLANAEINKLANAEINKLVLILTF